MLNFVGIGMTIVALVWGAIVVRHRLRQLASWIKINDEADRDEREARLREAGSPIDSYKMEKIGSVLVEQSVLDAARMSFRRPAPWVVLGLVLSFAANILAWLAST